MSCHASKVQINSKNNNVPLDETQIKSRVIIKKRVPPVTIDTRGIKPDQVVSFAKTLKGVPYKYGSVEKEKGLDCSGFIWYVFNHFNIKVVSL